MAEKGFGVKEINLIGASGTPTIESPNNLNLNAVNVAISTNATIGGNLTVSGTVGIAGTLTYEDVTNVDSIGILTARTGVKVLAGGINVVGVSYFNNNIVATATTSLSVTAADESSDTSCNVLFSTAATGNVAPKTGSNLTFNSSNGTLSATTFSGSGASLTNLPAGNLTGTLPAISGANLTNLPASTPADTDVQITFDISASGSSGYIFTGPGNDGSTVNPDIYLVRGQRYRFINTTGSSHPFEFRNAANSADYTDGITGSQSGTQDFNVQYDAPAQLKYRCTIHTGSMQGNIYIHGANGENTNVGITSFSGAVTATSFTGAVIATSLDIGSSNISSGTHTFTASAGTAVTADSTAIGSANAIEYTIFVSNSTNIQSQKVLIMDNGTTAYIQEFAAMSNPNLIATFSADVNSGNVRLLATPETGISGSTTIKFTKMIIE